MTNGLPTAATPESAAERSDNRYLISSSTMLLTSRLLGVGSIFLVTSILSNSPDVSAGEFGIYSTRVEYASLLSLFLGAGLPTAYLHLRGSGIGNSSKLFISSLSAYLVIGVAGVAVGLVARQGMVTYFALIVTLWLIQNLTTARTLSEGANRIFAFQLSLVPLALLLSITIARFTDLLRGDRLLAIYTMALAAGVTCSCLISLRRARPITIAMPAISTLWTGLTFGARIASLNILGLLLYVGDLALVERYADDNDLADYVIAGLLTKTVWMGTDAVGTILFPRITANRDRSKSLTIFALRVATAINVAAIVVFALVGRRAITIAFGESRTDSYGPTLLLLIGTVGISFYKLLNRYFGVHERWFPIYLGLVGAITLNLVLNVLLIPDHGGMGAAVASLVAYFACGGTLLTFFLRTGRPGNVPASIP